MKQYALILNVPDDFNPEELQINLDYKDEVELCLEDFVDNLTYLDPELFLEKIDVSKIHVGENDIVRFTFPESAAEAHGLEYLNAIRDTLESTCKCPVVGYANNMEVFVDNADDAIKMFNGMIAKVKTRAAVKSTSNIILT